MDINIKFQLFMKYQFIFKCLFFSVFVFLLTSCVDTSKPPKGFPDVEEFAFILADVHLADGLLEQMRMKGQFKRKEAPGYYHDVLAEYNLTQSKFDTIVSWYVSHPVVYQEAYELTIDILSEREANLTKQKKALEEEVALKEKTRQERNLWALDKSMHIKTKDTARNVPFAVALNDSIPDSLYIKGYKLSAIYQFLRGNNVTKPFVRLVTLSKDSIRDTVVEHFPVSYSKRKTELVTWIEPTDSLLSLEGVLLGHDTTKNIKVRVSDIFLEAIFDTISVDLDVSLKLDSISEDQVLDSINVEKSDTVQ